MSEQSSGGVFRADATVHIEAASHDEAQQQMEDWVAEHMPENFVIGWTLTDADETRDAQLPAELEHALRDPTIIIDRDREITMPDGRSLADHIRDWRDAPSNTASGGTCS